MSESASNENPTSLHQEIEFEADPQRIYEALLSSQQFAAFTGAPAEIDPVAGGAFSMFKDMILGCTVEAIPGERIVQAWRVAHWAPGVYSLVRFELRPRGSGTTVVLDHTGIPLGEFAHLGPGWKKMYWEPLQIFLA
jgi:activator of HSP90 ATPase